MVSWKLSDSAMRSRSTLRRRRGPGAGGESEQQHQHEPRAGLESHRHIPRPGAPSRRARYSYSNLRRSSAPGSSGTWRSHCSTAWSCSPLPASASVAGPGLGFGTALCVGAAFTGTGLRLFLRAGWRGLLPGRIGLRFAVGAGFVARFAALPVLRLRGLGWLVAVVPLAAFLRLLLPAVCRGLSVLLRVLLALLPLLLAAVLRLIPVLLLRALVLLLLALLHRFVHQLAVRGGVAHPGLARQRLVVGRERLLEPSGACQCVAAVVVRVGVVLCGPGPGCARVVAGLVLRRAAPRRRAEQFCGARRILVSQCARALLVLVEPQVLPFQRLGARLRQQQDERDAEQPAAAEGERGQRQQRERQPGAAVLPAVEGARDAVVALDVGGKRRRQQRGDIAVVEAQRRRSVRRRWRRPRAWCPGPRRAPRCCRRARAGSRPAAAGSGRRPRCRSRAATATGPRPRDVRATSACCAAGKRSVTTSSRPRSRPAPRAAASRPARRPRAGRCRRPA